MAKLTLKGCYLITRDLLDNKLNLVQGTGAWKIYEKPLRAKLEAMEALPDIGIRDSRPLTEELEEVDGLHDDLAAAARLILEGCLRYPRLGTEDREAAQRCLDFLPSGRDLNRSFEHQAASAAERKKRLAQFEADLRRFNAPFGGSNLLDWVIEHLDQGARLGSLLSQRGDLHAQSPEGRKAAGPLLATTAKLLRELRSSLNRELGEDGDTEPESVRKLFAYHDELLAAHAQRTAAKDKPEPSV